MWFTQDDRAGLSLVLSLLWVACGVGSNSDSGLYAETDSGQDAPSDASMEMDADIAEDDVADTSLPDTAADAVNDPDVADTSLPDVVIEDTRTDSGLDDTDVPDAIEDATGDSEVTDTGSADTDVGILDAEDTHEDAPEDATGGSMLAGSGGPPRSSEPPPEATETPGYEQPAGDNEVIYLGPGTLGAGGGADTIYVRACGGAISFTSGDGDVDRVIVDYQVLRDCVDEFAGTIYSDLTIFGFESGRDELHIPGVPNMLTLVSELDGSGPQVAIDDSSFGGDVVSIWLDADGDGVAEGRVSVWPTDARVLTASDLYL